MSDKQLPDEVTAVLDEWLTKGEYKVLHFWVRDTDTYLVIARRGATIYFERIFRMLDHEYVLSQDADIDLDVFAIMSEVIEGGSAGNTTQRSIERALRAIQLM